MTVEEFVRHLRKVLMERPEMSNAQLMMTDGRVVDHCYPSHEFDVLWVVTKEGDGAKESMS